MVRFTRFDRLFRTELCGQMCGQNWSDIIARQFIITHRCNVHPVSVPRLHPSSGLRNNCDGFISCLLLRANHLYWANSWEGVKRLEDPEHWVATVDRMERALQMATMLGSKSRMFTIATDHIERVLDVYNGEDPLFLSAKLMSLLQERRIGDPIKYAALAEKLAARAEATHDWHKAREYRGIGRMLASAFPHCQKAGF